MRRGTSVVLVAVLAAAGCFAVSGAVAQAPLAPAATTGAVSGVAPASATVGGTVNPNGQATTVAFDYGTSTAYGSSTAVQDAGSGTAGVPVTATLSGLVPSTTYHYRVIAASAGGTTPGADATLTTPAAPQPPTIRTGAASSVSTSQETVSATVTPHGQPTSVVFDYGTSTAYGATTSAQDAGQGTAAVTIKATLTGLAPGTRYHVRARATSATGTANGADVGFATPAAPGPTVATGKVSGAAPETATLTGSVNPRGTASQAYAEYGTTTGYGLATPRVSVGAGSASVAVRIPVTGLTAGTTYHYRLVGVNTANTTVRGKDTSFTTPKLATLTGLTATPSPVPYGHGASITGKVTGTGASGAAVTILGLPFPFTAAGALNGGTASAPGAFAIGVGPLHMTTRVAARVVAAGVTSQTAFLRVGVRPSVRGTVRRLSGHRLRFSGVIKPARAATVYLRKVGPHATVTVRRLRARGSYRFTIAAPKRTSTYRIRVRTDSHALQRFDTAPRSVAGRR